MAQAVAKRPSDSEHGGEPPACGIATTLLSPSLSPLSESLLKAGRRKSLAFDAHFWDNVNDSHAPGFTQSYREVAVVLSDNGTWAGGLSPNPWT